MALADWPKGRVSNLQKVVRWLWRNTRGDGTGLAPAQQRIARLAERLQPIHEQSPVKARRSYRRVDKAFNWGRVALPSIRDVTVDTEDGGSIVLRHYQPVGRHQTTARPGLVYYHGGGCVIGDLKTHDRFCRLVSHVSGLAVVSVDYRLAPEHRFPVPLEDAIRGWNWVYRNADKLHLDRTRLGVGGDSAGGYLAATVCHQAVDATLSVAPLAMPSFQWLIYPWLDCRLQTESARRCESGMLLTRAAMQYFVGQLLGGRSPDEDPVINPILWPQLDQLPPSYVGTVGYDPLEDEGRQYASALEAAGVPVTTDHFERVMHGCIAMTGVCPLACGVVETLIDRLNGMARS
jgi:acetyl esterase